MNVLQNAGDAAKGDQRGRKGGVKGNIILDLNFGIFETRVMTHNDLKCNLQVNPIATKL